MRNIEIDHVSLETILKVVVIVVLCIAMAWLYFTRGSNSDALMYVLVFALGGLLGLTEIFGRYADSPSAAMTSTGAFFYILVNAGASALGLFLLTKLAPDITNPITQVLIAWLGAMALLRSCLFRARVGNEEVAIGPAIILDTLLKFADAQVERARAIDRAARVSSVIKSLPLAQAGTDLPRLCFALIPDLPAETRQRILDDITIIITDTKRSEQMKAMEIGLVLWSRVGIGTLTGAVDLLRSNAHIPVAVMGAGSPAVAIMPPPTQGKPQDLVPEVQRTLAQDRKISKVS